MKNCHRQEETQQLNAMWGLGLDPKIGKDIRGKTGDI